MAKVTKEEPQRSTQFKVYDIPLRKLADNRTNPRDSLPTLLKMGYGIFMRLEGSDKPSLMEMALSEDISEQAAFADIIEKFEPTIAAMGADILDKGMIQPAGVSKRADGNYDVIFGCRRTIACAYNFVKTHATPNPTVPARLMEMNDNDAVFLSFSENHHRLGQSAIDEAKHFQRMRNMNIEIAEIARKCGVNDQHVRLRLKLNDLPQEVQDSIAAGKTSIVKALKAAGDPDLLAAAKAGDLDKSKTKNKMPTMREVQKWYETDNSLSEEVRKFIAHRLLRCRYSSR